MPKRKNIKKFSKKTTKKPNKSGTKNKSYNININIDNSKKSGGRIAKETNQQNKQISGNPYPVYNRAVPMGGGSTIVNNIPPLNPILQPQNNFNQQELKNIKDEILNRLNQPLTTPLLTHDPEFNLVRTDIEDLKNTHRQQQAEREQRRQEKEIEKQKDRELQAEFYKTFAVQQNMQNTSLTQNINKTKKDLETKIDQLNNLNALVPVNNRIDNLQGHFNAFSNNFDTRIGNVVKELQNFNKEALLLPNNSIFQGMRDSIKNIETNLLSSTPKLENQSEIKSQPKLLNNSTAEISTQTDNKPQLKPQTFDLTALDKTELAKQLYKKGEQGRQKYDEFSAGLAKEVSKLELKDLNEEYKNLYMEANKTDIAPNFNMSSGPITKEIKRLKEKIKLDKEKENNQRISNNFNKLVNPLKEQVKKEEFEIKSKINRDNLESLRELVKQNKDVKEAEKELNQLETTETKLFNKLNKMNRQELLNKYKNTYPKDIGVNDTKKNIIKSIMENFEKEQEERNKLIFK